MPYLHELFWETRWQWRLLLTEPKALLNPLLFFCLITLLFPLALGHAPDLLRQAAPGLIWVGLTLSVFLILPNLFMPDLQDGTLRLWVACRRPLSVYVLAKWITHWAFFVLPLILIAPWLGVSLYLDLSQSWLMMSLLGFGSFAMVGIGTIGVAVMQKGQYNPFLLAVLILPFYVPILIFGAGSLQPSAESLAFANGLLFLTGLVIFTLFLAPWAATQMLKLTVAQS
jgi:heme exporter protein B